MMVDLIMRLEWTLFLPNKEANREEKLAEIAGFSLFCCNTFATVWELRCVHQKKTNLPQQNKNKSEGDNN